MVAHRCSIRFHHDCKHDTRRPFGLPNSPIRDVNLFQSSMSTIVPKFQIIHRCIILSLRMCAFYLIYVKCYIGLIVLEMFSFDSGLPPLIPKNGTLKESQPTFLEKSTPSIKCIKLMQYCLMPSASLCISCRNFKQSGCSTSLQPNKISSIILAGATKERRSPQLALKGSSSAKIEI